MHRIVDRFERTGSVAATPRQHRLHEHDELILIELVCENLSVYLHEVQAKLLECTGTEASVATQCRTLKKLGFTRKNSNTLPYNGRHSQRGVSG